MTGATYGALAGAGSAALSNFMSFGSNYMAAEHNYELNELAAQNADKRTRALYNDFYSPQALVNQYEAAGLSPSLMFGGTPGQGGMSGAQGGGPAGPTPQTYGFNAAQDAQLALLKSQKDNLDADTLKKQNEAALTEVRTKVEDMQRTKFEKEYQILTSNWKNLETGKETSIFEIARAHNSYEDFLKALRTMDTDEDIKKATTTEAGQSILRSIFLGATQFHTDIMELTSKSVNAAFAMKVTECLDKAGFEEQNAAAAVQDLKAATESATLTETQKKAWNDMLSKMKDGTTKDLVLILGMMLMQFTGKINYRVNL